MLFSRLKSKFIQQLSETKQQKHILIQAWTYFRQWSMNNFKAEYWFMRMKEEEAAIIDSVFCLLWQKQITWVIES